MSVTKDVLVFYSFCKRMSVGILSTILTQDVTDAAELEDALRTQDADAIVSIRYM